MSFKPNEFFLGLVDFIAILLPGSLLTGILLSVDATQPGWHGFSGKGLYQLALNSLTSPVFWVGYVFVSFGLGYFLSSFASGLDLIFDKIRKQIYPYKENLVEQLKEPEYKAVRAKGLSWKEEKLNIKAIKEKVIDTDEYEAFSHQYTQNYIRRVCYFFFEFGIDLEVDNSFEAAKLLRNAYLKDYAYTMNVYKWCLVVLDTNYPGIAEQVNRTMAASKFFRSLVVVFALLLVLQAFKLLPASMPYWPGILFLILSFREYVVQRYKSIQAAYKGVFSLYFLPDKLKNSK